MNIEQIIFSKKTPVICLARVSNDRVQRAMGFLLKEISPGIKLAVTAKHNFQKFPIEDFNIFSGCSEIKIKSIANSFYLEIVEDVCFFLVEDNRKDFLFFKNNFQYPQKNKVKNLFNLKCEFNPKFHQRYFFDLFIQDWKPSDSIILSKDYSEAASGESYMFDKKDKELILKKKEEGYFHEYRTVLMQSLPGCSGSPIFDSNMHLYGMNIRGNDNYLLGYITIQKIEKIFYSFESNIKALI